VTRSSVKYVANEENADIAAVRASLRPVLIASESTLTEQSSFLRHLLVGLVDESVETTLICPPGYEVESIVPMPVTVLVHPLVDLPLIKYFGAGRLTDQLAKFRPTILHSLCESKASLARRLARRLDVPYIQMVNSLAGRFSRIPLSPHGCRAVIAPAQTIAASITRAYPRFRDRVRQINIGSFIEEDTVCFSDPSRLPSIVLAQPLQRVSDFGTFFKVVTALLADGREFMVVLMGSGPAEHGLRRLLDRLGISPAVIIVPILDPWRSVVAAGDIFVRPRPLRAFSMFLLEAMSLGTAVAACKGGVDDLIVPDQTAIVFEPDDEQSIRQALTQLLDQHDFARQLAMTAQEHVRTHYSVSQMISDTLKTYVEVQQLHED
jgi:glycosyltransferase involved in cell wall biosynthesis